MGSDGQPRRWAGPRQRSKDSIGFPFVKRGSTVTGHGLRCTTSADGGCDTIEPFAEELEAALERHIAPITESLRSGFRHELQCFFSHGVVSVEAQKREGSGLNGPRCHAKGDLIVPLPPVVLSELDVDECNGGERERSAETPLDTFPRNVGGGKWEHHSHDWPCSSQSSVRKAADTPRQGCQRGDDHVHRAFCLTSATDDFFTPHDTTPSAWGEGRNGKERYSRRSNMLRRSSVGLALAEEKIESTLWSVDDVSQCVCIMRKVKSIVKGPWFDHAVCILIGLNAVAAGLSTDYRARNIEAEPSVYIRVLGALELAFFGFFFCEVALRILAHGREFLFSGNWRWNMLDVCIIVIETLDLAVFKHNVQNVLNFSTFRVFRVLRFFRVLRILRIMNLMRELRTLMHSIVNSLKALFWTSVLLLLLIYTIAIYFTELVTEARVSHRSSHAGLKQYYGTLPVTMRSFYQAITGGLDWQVMIDPLEAGVSQYMSIFICLYIAFATLAMLNVVTGVFVESVLQSAKETKELVLVNNARCLFESLEGGLTDQMSWEVFESKLDSKPLREFFKSIRVDRADALGLFRLFDLDDSGSISASEFLSGCLRLNGTAKALDLALISRELKLMEDRICMYFSKVDELVRERAVPV
eukprot:TRINITY_DN19993_c0_g1_i1.p1 TRINITY_DN19993_c0_g1~~TRINITY_DN19993_c0_g1_i1.p1  ORF type:complete len:641 (+),score=93.89 TRINITY_DN19993_c0_g1_i1:85-2007(+)